MKKNIAVIGGGAAGMMAAYAAAKSGAQVTLYEKNEKLGKKIYITGKGRCNVTNDCSRDVFFDQVVTNPKFLYSAFETFDNQAVMQLLEQAGCPLKTERGNRVFPVSDHSSDVIRALERLLQKEGVKVIHGASGLKVHSKIVLVERKDKGYVYVGTGNFNEATTPIYGDFGLFTSDVQIATDAKTIFDFLLNTHKHFACKQLLVAPYYMRKKFESLIRQEIKNAQMGKEAYIYAKFNSLTDEPMINLLYKASKAGVKIRLIVRGACSLQPQVKKQSENIRVISIVDRYLEHARLAIFANGGEETIYIMGADWMTRNLDRRVEVGIPIKDEKIKQTLRGFFDIQWEDNEKARDLTVLGSNRYVDKGDNPPCRSQIALFDFYKEMK